MPAHLSESDIRDYRQCGVVVIRGALTPAQVATLRNAIDDAARGSDIDPACCGPNAKTKPLKVFESFPCYRDYPAYKEIVLHSDLPRIAALLTGSRTMRLHHTQVHCEVPKEEVRTPWHEDHLFYNADGIQNLSIFVTVDPIPLGNAEFVLGSHKWPASMPRYLREMFANWLPTSEVPEPVDVEAARSVMPVVSWALQPGDCLAFNFHTLHFLKCATALRRGMSVRYIGDDAVYAPRRWKTFPEMPALEKDNEGMKAGCPMHHSLFPVVYTGCGHL